MTGNVVVTDTVVLTPKMLVDVETFVTLVLTTAPLLLAEDEEFEVTFEVTLVATTVFPLESVVVTVVLPVVVELSAMEDLPDVVVLLVLAV